MGTDRELYGVTRTVPSNEETGYGDDMTNFELDLITGVDGTSHKKSGVAVACFPPKANATYAAGATLTPTHPQHRISGAGAPVTLSAVTAIADGSKVGEILVIKGNSDINTVTILDAANTKLNGPMVLALNDKIELEWDGSDWVERWRSV